MANVNVELWVVVDEDGAYSCGVDADTANDNYESEHGNGHTTAKRVLKVNLAVPTPRTVEVTASVPDLADVSGVAVN